MNEAKQIVLDFVIRYVFQFVGACVILTAGFFLSKWAGQLLVKGLSRHQMEPPVRTLPPVLRPLR